MTFFSYLWHFWRKLIFELDIYISVYLNYLSTCICNIWHWRSSDFDMWHATLTVRWQTSRSLSDLLSWLYWWFPWLLPWEYSPSIPSFTLTQEVSKLEGNCFNLKPIRCLPPPWALSLQMLSVEKHSGTLLKKTERLLSVEVLNLREQTNINM